MSIAYPLIRLSISHTSHVATGKSTRPRGARLRRTICDFWSRNFNPRARMGRDTSRTPIRASPSSFNPRARVGRDSLWTSLSQSFASFNPRARVGRDQISSRIILTRSSFNPRARVGRDGPARRRLSVHRVSIHAPAWGATSGSTSSSASLGFQSTRPRGARLAICAVRVRVDLVSIHAPAWGATSRPEPSGTGPASFNPRARVGRDCLLTGQIPTIRQSNLTSKPQQS